MLCITINTGEHPILLFSWDETLFFDSKVRLDIIKGVDLFVQKCDDSVCTSHQNDVLESWKIWKLLVYLEMLLPWKCNLSTSVLSLNKYTQSHHRLLDSVPPTAISHFKQSAEKLIEEKGAVEALAAALAHISGATSVDQRSLINSDAVRLPVKLWPLVF